MTDLNKLLFACAGCNSSCSLRWSWQMSQAIFGCKTVTMATLEPVRVRCRTAVVEPSPGILPRFALVIFVWDGQRNCTTGAHVTLSLLQTKTLSQNVKMSQFYVSQKSWGDPTARWQSFDLSLDVTRHVILMEPYWAPASCKFWAMTRYIKWTFLHIFTVATNFSAV